MKSIRYFMLVGLLMGITASASAQVTFGAPPFGTVASNSAPDVIDLANLNAHIQIPVLHKAGRGEDFTYDIGYDNSIWYPVTSGSTKSWQPNSNWGWGGNHASGNGILEFVDDECLRSRKSMPHGNMVELCVPRLLGSPTSICRISVLDLWRHKHMWR